MCRLLSAWTMNIAITDCSVRAKACSSGMLLGMKASQFVRMQDFGGVRDKDVEFKDYLWVFTIWKQVRRESSSWSEGKRNKETVTDALTYNDLFHPSAFKGRLNIVQSAFILKETEVKIWKSIMVPPLCCFVLIRLGFCTNTQKKNRESSSAGAGNEDSHLLLAGLKPRIWTCREWAGKDERSHTVLACFYKILYLTG